jgi:GTPase Era involved in 16S rRNA processing
LQESARQLSDTPWRSWADRLERLAVQVDEPCVVAVVGEVKAGKSTFINAFLGGDYAKTGTTETTATINYFRYGTPDDPARPIKCLWHGAEERYTWETREFLDALQGHELEGLEQASRIARLEYLIPSDVLREGITLVDTPGLGAVVDEHQNATAEYLQLARQMRQIHERETKDISDRADAIVFLSRPVGGAKDMDFLREFQEAMGGLRTLALNAVGIIGQIDVNMKRVELRHRLSQDLAGQYREQLSAVLPVSAALQQTMVAWRDAAYAPAREIRRVFEQAAQAPAEVLERLLSDKARFDENRFANPEVRACLEAFSEETRRALHEEIPWSVFTLMVRTLLAFDFDEALDRLWDYAGFDQVNALLKNHFFNRGQILRCFRITQDAYRLVSEELRKRELPRYRAAARDIQKRRDAYRRFLTSVDDREGVAERIWEELDRALPAGADLDSLEKPIGQGELALAAHRDTLKSYNEDYQAWSMLEEHRQDFSEAEIEELRRLFGGGGLEADKRVPEGCFEGGYLSERNKMWRRALNMARPGSWRQRIAERAWAQYGELQNALDGY